MIGSPPRNSIAPGGTLFVTTALWGLSESRSRHSTGYAPCDKVPAMSLLTLVVSLCGRSWSSVRPATLSAVQACRSTIKVIIHGLCTPANRDSLKSLSCCSSVEPWSSLGTLSERSCICGGRGEKTEQQPGSPEDTCQAPANRNCWRPSRALSALPLRIHTVHV